MQNYFVERAKKYHKKLYAEDDNEIKARPKEFFIDHYVGKNDIYKKLIRETLNEARRQSLVYFEKREKVALVNSYRL